VRARRVFPTFLIVTAVLIFVAACAATKDAGRPFPSEARGKLVLNRTIKREAERLLGPPFTTTTDAEGRELWTYEHSQVSATRAIPFGRRVTARQTPYEQLVLTFQYGLLSDCVYVIERYRSEGDQIVATGAQRESCGRR
jgi:hypothetical protein